MNRTNVAATGALQMIPGTGQMPWAAGSIYHMDELELPLTRVSVHPEMANLPDIRVARKNLILGISTICLRLNFSCALISTQFAYFWMDTS